MLTAYRQLGQAAACEVYGVEKTGGWLMDRLDADGALLAASPARALRAIMLPAAMYAAGRQGVHEMTEGRLRAQEASRTELTRKRLAPQIESAISKAVPNPLQQKVKSVGPIPAAGVDYVNKFWPKRRA